MRENSGADRWRPVGGRRGRYQQWRADASTCSVLWYGVGETWMQVLIYSQCSWKGLKCWCSNITWYHHWPSQHLEDSFEELKGPCNRWGKCDHWQNQKPSRTAEKDVKSLVAVPCVCHKLTLASTDTDVDLQVVKNVQTEVTQLWKIFENSPKKLAAYLKVQEEMKEVTLVPRQVGKLAKV